MVSTGTGPIPDGQTVPHTAATLAAVMWARRAFRLVRLRYQLGRYAYIGCMILTFLLVTAGIAATHPSH